MVKKTLKELNEEVEQLKKSMLITQKQLARLIIINMYNAFTERMQSHDPNYSALSVSNEILEDSAKTINQIKKSGSPLKIAVHFRNKTNKILGEYEESYIRFPYIDEVE